MKLYVQLPLLNEAVVTITTHNGNMPSREPTGPELLTIISEISKAVRVNDPAGLVTTKSRHD